MNHMNRVKEVLEEKGIKQTWLADKICKSFSQTNAYVCNLYQGYSQISNKRSGFIR
ncbi:MAG: hypothetical protein ACRC77_08320 [Bacteroidales bacterium]